MNACRRMVAVLLAVAALAGCTVPAPKPAPVAPPRIALALGGGAARGFAHIGVIKALEAQGIVPDIVVGTSAGSVVGSLYAAGLTGFELQKVALQMDEAQVSDWSLPDRGVLKGEALQNFINRAVANRPLEKLNRTFAVVATDLQSGEPVVFRTGNTGMAVRASSCVPGVFQPVSINGRDYVDGGLVSPVPVRTAKSLGADLIIAVDISAKPQNGKTQNTVGVLLQTFAIMGQSISRYELAEADVVIRPQLSDVAATDFQGRHLAVMEGEKAAAAALPEIRRRLALIAAAGARPHPAP
ncbi:MAG TPA: patatin-like phospholipase family protein [Rhodocyclaceae bacterium]